MDDDKLKNLFGNFEPDISSDVRFMSELQRSMEAVELIRRQHVAVHRRNIIAGIIAAFSGFVIGVLLMLLFPLIGDWVSTVNISIPMLDIILLTVDSQTLCLVVVAIGSGVTACNAYEITLSVLPMKKSVPLLTSSDASTKRRL